MTREDEQDRREAAGRRADRASAIFPLACCPCRILQGATVWASQPVEWIMAGGGSFKTPPTRVLQLLVQCSAVQCSAVQCIKAMAAGTLGGDNDQLGFNIMSDCASLSLIVPDYV